MRIINSPGCTLGRNESVPLCGSCKENYYQSVISPACIRENNFTSLVVFFTVSFIYITMLSFKTYSNILEDTNLNYVRAGQSTTVVIMILQMVSTTQLPCRNASESLNMFLHFLGFVRLQFSTQHDTSYDFYIFPSKDVLPNSFVRLASVLLVLFLSSNSILKNFQVLISLIDL